MQSSNGTHPDCRDQYITKSTYLVAAPPRMFAVVATEDRKVFALPVAYFRERVVEHVRIHLGDRPRQEDCGISRPREVMVIADPEHGKPAVHELGEAIEVLGNPRGCRIVAASWPASADRKRFLEIAADIIAGRTGYCVGAVPGPEEARS